MKNCICISWPGTVERTASLSFSHDNSGGVTADVSPSDFSLCSFSAGSFSFFLPWTNAVSKLSTSALRNANLRNALD